ncbi:squalene cyclase [Parenemella sanctibonifatiensis]|uniref:Squalene cyclase n=1 Tax=Parenemella sanctibonifatiensis TaxID=2016505 RepID=A0A255E9G4_9ACTN|nr:squalene cyclase [Parenemella sanctibonifatiensis]OYN88209.1 squalene cyclase [Parenemella sanctibonifatiensis]
MSQVSGDTLEWLLDSDPALRWQVERDLVGVPEEQWRATRALVNDQGWGAELLSHQDPEGTWAGGAHFPAGFFDDPANRDAGQPWTATTWSLKSLQEWGVDPARLGDTADRIAQHCTWEYEDLPFWQGEVDACINSYVLSAAAWLGVEVPELVQWFADNRLEDGGWNCFAIEQGSVRSSFDSTLSVVKALLTWEQVTGDTSLGEARHSGEAYLLARRLMFRLSTGEPYADTVTDFIAPNRHQYHALAALDHFRSASRHDQTAPDPRLTEAVDTVRQMRLGADSERPGAWLQGTTLPGRVWFEIDAPTGEPSRWLTLQGTRVLDWWDGHHAAVS